MPNDLTPYLHGLTPDPEALTDARTYARTLPASSRLAGRLEDLLMCFSSFAVSHTGPRLPGGHSEALYVLAFAASGLYAFLKDAPHGEAWATLSRARLWTVDKCQRATASLSREDVEALHLAFANPHTLPAWAERQGRSVEAGRLAAWWAVSHLLEAAPDLEDGEAEGLTAAMLEAFTSGPHPMARAAHLFASFEALTGEDEAAPIPLSGVHTAQGVGVLPGQRVRVCMGGGEDHEVSRSACTLTPLPDGGAFLAVFVGTPDAHTVRLTPEDCRTVCQVFEWDTPDEDEDSRMSPLN